MAIAACLLRSSAALLVVQLSGCGRIGFAQQGLTSDGPATDGLDGVPLDGPAPCDRTADFGPPVLLAGVSSDTSSEATMRLLPDELTGYLWTTRTGNIDLAKVTRAQRGDTFTYQPFDELNTDDPEFEPTISSDDAVLVFRSNRPGGAGGSDLYLADRALPGGPLVLRRQITELSSASADLQPFLTDAELLFISDRSGADRMYRSRRIADSFAAATEITELAVAGASDSDPVMTADGKTIYFGSTRPGGIGGIDIWSASRLNDLAPFAAATLVANVNSVMTDAPSWISLDQCRLYMSSSRGGTADVYVATRP
jgi:hypothetical protein